MSSLGSYLKREREQRQVSVAELAQTTRIPVRLLQKLENDDSENLPSDVFVRGFLRAYSRALGIDEEHVLSRYRGRPSTEPPPALPVAYAPESGRRFGIAIALFILLILFTLALSIVLRPRHRDTPVELSQRPALRLEVGGAHAGPLAHGGETTSRAPVGSAAG